MKINVKRSPSIWVLYPILYIIWILNVANHLKRASQKNEGKKFNKTKLKPTNLFQHLVWFWGRGDTELQWRSLLLHWQWPPFLTLFTILLLQSVSLGARSLSISTSQSRFGSHSQCAALLRKLCSLLSGTRETQDRLREDKLPKKWRRF